MELWEIEKMGDRYFDATTGAWVTVLPPGKAKGAHTAASMRGLKASGYRAAKAASAAKAPAIKRRVKKGQSNGLR